MIMSAWLKMETRLVLWEWQPGWHFNIFDQVHKLRILTTGSKLQDSLKEDSKFAKDIYGLQKAKKWYDCLYKIYQKLILVHSFERMTTGIITLIVLILGVTNSLISL